MTAAAAPILAVDPGREKCGIAVVAHDGSILNRAIVPTESLVDAVRERLPKYSPVVCVIGNGTGSGNARAEIAAALPNLSLAAMDEYRTTDEARGLYWKVYPPSGWRRLLPTSMQTPPANVDDFAAVVLARRYLSSMEN